MKNENLISSIDKTLFVQWDYYYFFQSIPLRHSFTSSYASSSSSSISSSSSEKEKNIERRRRKRKKCPFTSPPPRWLWLPEKSCWFQYTTELLYTTTAAAATTREWGTLAHPQAGFHMHIYTLYAYIKTPPRDLEIHSCAVYIYIYTLHTVAVYADRASLFWQVTYTQREENK